MIIYSVNEESLKEAPHIIPAIYTEEDGLIYAHNGISSKYISDGAILFNKIKRESFQLFGYTPLYQGKGQEAIQRPFFLRWGEDIKPELWELFYVFGKRTNGSFNKKYLQYTCLTECKPGTYFCECKDCSRRFIVLPGQAKFYQERGIEIPVTRCQECIQKKKIKFRA